MEMGDRSERRFTQFLFQEEPLIPEDVAKEGSTAFRSYAPEGVRLKKKKGDAQSEILQRDNRRPRHSGLSLKRSRRGKPTMPT